MKAKGIWTVLWAAGCLAAAVWVGCAVQQPRTSCAQSDLAFGTVESAAGQPQENSQQKRVFLTFDDGPSATTELVLDTLKEKGVKGTFFVVASENNQNYLHLIERATQEGHQIALHSCTHEYSSIYASTTAFWADIKELRQKISPYTDVDRIHWLRFPGGSTNTVSHKYGGSSIMKTLKAQAAEKGYRYIDWNVCANDAVGGHPSADTIYHNVVDSVQDRADAVVLMHDTKATKTTAEALPDIIDWFAAQGYTFCTLDAMDGDEAQPTAS